MLTCQELTELVTEYAEGRMSLGRRMEFWMHLAMCRHCRAYVEQLRATVRAVGAPDDVARLLEVPEGSPLLMIRRVAFTLDDRPVEFRRSYVNTAAHEYQREPGY